MIPNSAYPYTFTVQFDISAGSVWGGGFVLDYSQLGVGTFSDGSTYDITDTVQKIDIGGGYDLLQDQWNANKGKIVVIDSTGLWNPQNTSSPFYGKLLPLRKIRLYINAVDSAGNILQQVLFGTYFTVGYNYSYPQGQQFGYVTIEVMDAFRVLNMSNITTVAGAVAGETTGARINRILDAISWPTSLRNIEAGTQTVGADPATPRTALNAIKNAEFVEQGAFFIDQYGKATFLSGATVAKRKASIPLLIPVGTYIDWVQTDPNGKQLQYKSITPVLDDKLIINQATMQANGGAAQTVTDSNSVASYFTHTVTQQQLVGKDNNQMLNLAGIYVATHAQTSLRFDTMAIDFTQQVWADGWPVTVPPCFSYVPLQAIRVNNVQYSGSSNITQTVIVVGSNIYIDPTHFNYTLTTSQGLLAGFILADTSIPPITPAGSGILGTTPLGY